MNTIIAMFFITVFPAFWIWVFWGFLSVIYHAVMVAFYAVAWTFIGVLKSWPALAKPSVAWFPESVAIA